MLLCVQLMADQQSQEYMRGRKTLELNPQHPIIQSLKSTASSNPGEAKVEMTLWPGCYTKSLLLGM